MRDTTRRALVLGITSVLIFLADFMQFQVAGYAYELVPALGMTTAQFSSLLTAPMLMAVFASVPVGAATDRFRFKRVVMVANVLACGGAALRLAAWDYPSYLAAMLLLGASPAALNANLIKIFGTWFGERINFAMGAFYASGSLGTICALAASGFVADVHVAYGVTLVALVAATVAWGVCVRSRPAGAGGEGVGVPKPNAGPQRYVGVVARNPYVWVIALAFGTELAASTAYIGFLPQYFELGRGMEAGAAGLLAAAFTCGSMAGSMAGPAVVARVGRARPVLLTCAVASGALLACAWACPWPVLPLVLFCAGALATANGPVLEAAPFGLPGVGERYAGSAGGLVAMVAMALAFVLPLVVSAAWGQAYGAIFVTMGVLFVFSAAFIVRIPEKV